MERGLQEEPVEYGVLMPSPQLTQYIALHTIVLLFGIIYLHTSETMSLESFKDAYLRIYFN